MKHGLKALIFSLIFVFGIFNVLSLADTEYSLTVIQNGMRVTTQKAPGTNITLGIKPESGVKGWKVEQGDITINNNSFTMPEKSVVISARYDLDAYTITYNLDGGINNSSNPTTYNEETETITLQAPTKVGYTFTGWTGSNGTTPELTVTIPKGSSGNKEFTANWQINSYTVTATAGTGGTISPTSTTIAYGGSATFTITQNSGYVLSSLKVDGNAVDTTLSYTITNVQKDTIVTAEFSPISYTISYDLDGGTGSNPTSYTIETESFTLSEPTKEGYTFTGWTGSNGTTAQTEVTIVKGSTGDKSYTANWESSIGTPNAPVITTGLTPVNWNGNSWAETTVAEWDYNYNSVAEMTSNGTVEGDGNGKWANAQTADGSLYVWIPRYTYKITSGYHSSGNSWNADSNPGSNKIEIKFSSGTTDNNSDSYLSHPAFTFGTTELKGIWVAKYEASRDDATASSAGSGTTVSSKPGVISWTNISVSNMFDYSYNLNRDLDSHLMKNVEWGAVAYLTNAIGRIPYINNSSSYITGNAGGSQNASSASGVTNAWNTANGVKASTTHNVYGIYDLSGGATEYVAAYLNNGDSNLISYANSLVISYSNYGSKYVDVYPIGTSDSSADNYAAWSGIKGDAVYETSRSSSSAYSWDGDYSNAPNYHYPVFTRGGYYDSTSSAGVFCFDYNFGYSRSSHGFRPVLAIQ